MMAYKSVARIVHKKQSLFHIGPAHRTSTLDESRSVGQVHLSPFDKGDTAKPRGIDELRNRTGRFVNNPG